MSERLLVGDARWRDLYGLYAEGWDDRIVPEAFAHPAKIAPALARRIVSHGIAAGYWVPGRDVIVDPFAGIGGCLLTCGWQGLQAVGVELEPHFVSLCEQDIALHAPLWGRHGNVRPVVVQGDSRELRRHVARAMGSLSSPPYAETVSSDGSGIDWGKSVNPRTRDDKSVQNAEAHAGRYGTTPGNLGNLRAGSLSSPPYAESLQAPGGSRTPNAPDGFKLGRSTPGHPCGPNSQLAQTSYGSTPGQLGALKGGSLASPPFEDSDQRGCPESKWGLIQACIRDGRGHSSTHLPPSMGKDYGDTAGQLGNDRGPTFWDALRVIAAELHALLAPGSVCAWVCKDFVRAKQRVTFCDDFCTLVAQCGFTVFERWRCWQVSRTKQATMFSGTKPQSEHKGFFRRLAEAKGSPRIDFEEVVWFAKGTGELGPLFEEADADER